MPDLTIASAVDTFLGSADQAAMLVNLGLGTPTTIGKAILNLTNPGAITFLRMNADNTLSVLSAADMRTALGLGTMAMQASNSVAITAGSITGLATFQSSDPNFAVDSNGNLVAKYFKLNNSGGNQTSLFLAQVSGAVPSTVSTFAEVLRLAGGALYIQPAGTGTVIGGALYLGVLGTVITGATNTVQIGATSSSPAAQSIKGPNGSGTNIAGGKLGIAAGQSTGSATPAVLALQSTAAGSSGTTAQTLVDVFSILNSEYISIGSGVIIDGSGAGFRLGNTGSSFLGLWGAAPVQQFATSGGAGISNSGSGTAVHDDSTFVGSVGVTAYTINDIISALKLSGVIAQ